MPLLYCEKGPDRGREFPIKPGHSIVIGRDATATIVLTDPLCSRKHCAVGEHKGAWLIKDLRSANGTWCNGAHVPPEGTAALSDGASIQIGETLLSFLAANKRLSDDPLIGKEIAGYRIEQRLGRGAMGVVYKAHQLSLGRDVALKILSTELADNARFTTMFVKEARAAAALNHQNIIQVYDVGKAQGYCYISMELAMGGSVLDELRSAETIGLDRSLEIVKDALAALEYAQRKQLVHRDIKPDNLMIGAEGVVKLGDLGLAATPADLRTVQTGVFGTPHYIAPEQAMGKAIDHRADIYALGATWYRLLTGQTLFDGADAREILKKQVHQPHRPLRALVPDMPPAISRIVDRMLEKTPERRYQSAAEVLYDLELFEHNRDAARGPVATPQIAQRVRAPVLAGKRKSNLPAILVAAILVAALLGAGYWYFLRGNNAGGPHGNGDQGGGDEGPKHSAQGDNAATREADARAAYVRAEALEADDPVGAMQAYHDLSQSWPDTEAARGATERATLIEGQVRNDEAQVEAAKKQWNEVVRAIDRGEVPAYRLDAMHARLDAFLGELKASQSPAVRGLVKQLDLEGHRRVWDKAIRDAFARQLEHAANTIKAVANASLRERLRAYRAALEIAQALSAATDNTSLKDDAAQSLKAWQSEFDALALAWETQAQRERAAEARSKTSALIARLAEFDGYSARFRQHRVVEVCEALQTDARFLEFKESAEFREYALLLDDVMAQARGELAALAWIGQNWAMERSVEMPVELTESGAIPLALRRVRLVKLLKDEPWFGFKYAGVFTDGSDLAEQRRLWSDLDPKAFSALMRWALQAGVSPLAGLLSRAEYAGQRMGLGSLLLRMGATETACDLLDGVVLPKDANETDRRRAREYMAYSLAARAALEAERDNVARAEELLARLKRDFSDTRAYRGVG